MHLSSGIPLRPINRKESQMINGIEDDESEESHAVKMLPNCCLPCQTEIDEHNVNHLPFRDWCSYCVQGKGVSYPHLKRKEAENEVAIISSDYMGVKQREPEEGQNPILVMVDRKTKMKFADVLEQKGVEHYAVERQARNLTDGLGYSKFIMKDDQEPAIKALRESVVRRVIAIKGEGVQVLPEESPVGESQSNGEVEAAIKQVQGHIRTLRLHLQARYKEVLGDGHVAMLLLVPHSAASLNRYLIGADGKTARQRLKGRAFRGPVVEFGECVWYLQPKSAGKDKLNSRWGEGVWFGVREESGETLIGTREGVIKVRTIRRKAGAARWNKELMDAVKGTPWEPVPGRHSTEVPIKIGIPEEDKVIIEPAVNQEKAVIKRDFKISRDDVTRYGLTPGCKGCLAADARDPVARNHTVNCRNRMLKEISEHDQEKLIKITDKFLKEEDRREELKSEEVPIVNDAEELPRDIDEEMERGHVTARSSGDEAPEDDVNMHQVIYQVTADWDLSQRFNEAPKKKKRYDDDVKRMNKALAEEGFGTPSLKLTPPSESQPWETYWASCPAWR